MAAGLPAASTLLLTLAAWALAVAGQDLSECSDVDSACWETGEFNREEAAEDGHLHLLQRRGAIGGGSSRGARQDGHKEPPLPKPSAREAARPLGPIPDGWQGPRPQYPLLWGGPDLAWSEQDFTHQVIPADGAEAYINYAKASSDVPFGLQGVFWMDQSGVSSVAKMDSYGYNFQGLPEVLIGFGTGGDDGATFQKDTRCLTPIPFYGGRHITAWDDGQGEELMAYHKRCRSTLSFCFTDDSYEVAKIYQKQLTDETSLGPVKLGSRGARWFDFIEAGGGYSWTADGAMTMSMEKAPWGWDRYTSVPVKFTKKVQFFVDLIPGASWLMDLARGEVFKYPVLQIVDGNGKRTKYYAEYLAAYREATDGHMLSRVAVSAQELGAASESARATAVSSESEGQP